MLGGEEEIAAVRGQGSAAPLYSSTPVDPRGFEAALPSLLRALVERASALPLIAGYLSSRSFKVRSATDRGRNRSSPEEAHTVQAQILERSGHDWIAVGEL